MTRKGFRRLALFTIIFYIFLTLTFHSNISELSLPYFDTNASATSNFQTHEHVPKSARNSSANTLQPEVLSVESPETNVNFTFPKFNRTRPIVFLHIGKNGGTSFDVAVRPVVGHLHGRYVGNKHFDWSRVETIPNADVVVLLREPVSRSVSHYYFMRKWSKNALNQGALSNYLKNPNAMLETRDCWQDGQASVSWLTGTHIANWVGITKDKVPLRERMSLNITEMCMLAAKRLESVFWFGIIEDSDRSFELLQYQLGLSQKIKFPKSNANTHNKASENETRILESLMPQDVWLYKYAKLLFEARWTFYKTGVYKHPDMPPVPSLENVPCISTRTRILCKKGPLSPLYHVNSKASEQDVKLPDGILNRFNH